MEEGVVREYSCKGRDNGKRMKQGQALRVYNMEGLTSSIIALQFSMKT